MIPRTLSRVAPSLPALVLPLALLASGCSDGAVGKTYRVDGKVTLNGEPLVSKTAVVLFEPDTAKGNMTLFKPVGSLDSGGNYTLYSNYDRQVQALLAGHIDIAWNTNLAWAKVRHLTNGACRVLAMRDADAAFTTILAARADRAIESPADLRGMRVALGSADSAQAAILPLHHLAQAGLDPERDCTLLRFDLDVGKHGDTGTSELEVLRALREGQADAGFLGDSTWHAQLAKGAIDPGEIRAAWTSPGYWHCNFTVRADFPEELGRRWTASLLAMSYADPCWRPLMEMEGLRRWIPADAKTLEGYQVLLEAVERQGLPPRWGA